MPCPIARKRQYRDTAFRFRCLIGCLISYLITSVRYKNPYGIRVICRTIFV